MGDADQGSWVGGRTGRRRLGLYIVRHWCGELSLADSFLQSGVLAYLVVLSPCVAILLFAAQFAPQPLVLLWEPLAWLIALPIATWHLGGIWRSAGRTAASDGQRLDALFPRCAVLLALLAIIDLLWVRAVPQAREGLDIVFRGDPRIGPHTVRLLPGGTELEFAGGLTIGVSDEIEKFLAADPNVRVIHLNSPGGRLSEGIALETLIRRHRLITYTSTQCASACTLAFLGGRERWVGPTAVLGFHRGGHYPGETRAENERSQAVYEAELRQAGVAPDFVAKVMATPYDRLWEPTPDELLESGVATNLSDGSQFRISGIEDMSVEGLERELLMRPGWAALNTLDPAAFRRLRTAIAAAAGEGRSERDIWLRLIAELEIPMRRNLARASDDAIAAIAGVWVDVIDKRSSQITCDDLFAGDLDLPEIQAIIMDFGGLYIDAMDRVFESVVAAPAPALSAERTQQELNMLHAAIDSAGRQDLILLQTSDTDPNIACRVRVELYRAALALPADRRGPALRALVSQ
jgi:hypothetical protein